MFPIVEIPQFIQDYLNQYRAKFCRDEGFDHVCLYIVGLILSPNKTVQGIYDNIVWDDKKPSKRAMHEAIFEANWDSNGIMSHHQKIIGDDHKGKGPEVISLDWTFSHHDKGPKIYGTKKLYDYANNKTSLMQTVVTAVIANRDIIDGIDVVVQEPSFIDEEKIYLNATVKKGYNNIKDARTRLLELLHFRKHSVSYKTRPEIAADIVKNIEKNDTFREAPYVFDNGLLSDNLAGIIKREGKQWVSEIEKNRKIIWNNQWTSVHIVAGELAQNHAETAFRPVTIECRNGDKKKFWVFTKVVRLKKFGRLRLAIVHEKKDLSDKPRFLVCSARHWEAKKILRTWNYRWPCETFHEFVKQRTGFESAQLRSEEAVKRHFRLSCVAQSMIQRISAASSTSEEFDFEKEKATIGQKCRVIAREAFRSLLTLAKKLFEEEKSVDEVLGIFVPT